MGASPDRSMQSNFVVENRSPQGLLLARHRRKPPYGKRSACLQSKSIAGCAAGTAIAITHQSNGRGRQNILPLSIPQQIEDFPTTASTAFPRRFCTDITPIMQASQQPPPGALSLRETQTTNNVRRSDDQTER